VVVLVLLLLLMLLLPLSLSLSLLVLLLWLSSSVSFTLPLSPSWSALSLSLDWLSLLLVVLVLVLLLVLLSLLRLLCVAVVVVVLVVLLVLVLSVLLSLLLCVDACVVGGGGVGVVVVCRNHIWIFIAEYVSVSGRLRAHSVWATHSPYAPGIVRQECLWWTCFHRTMATGGFTFIRPDVTCALKPGARGYLLAEPTIFILYIVISRACSILPRTLPTSMPETDPAEFHRELFPYGFGPFFLRERHSGILRFYCLGCIFANAPTCLGQAPGKLIESCYGFKEQVESDMWVESVTVHSVPWRWESQLW